VHEPTPQTSPAPVALDDDALLAAFAALRLPAADFHQREHIRLAFTLLRRHDGDLATSAAVFRALLQRFAAAIGVASLYHETITWAYLAIIAERMHGRGYATSAELLADHPDLLDHRTGALARCYDVAAITQSPVARAVFVLPVRR
jgi:hypothetical protein